MTSYDGSQIFSLPHFNHSTPYSFILATWLRNAEIKNALPDCVVRILGKCPYTNGHSRQKQTFITETILTWWVVELGYLLLHDIWHYMCVWARVSPQNRNSKHETILYFATDLYLSPPLPDPTYKFICVSNQKRSASSDIRTKLATQVKLCLHFDLM